MHIYIYIHDYIYIYIYIYIHTIYSLYSLPCTASRRPASSPDVEVRKNRRVHGFHGSHGGMRRVDFLKIYGTSMNFDDCLGEIIMK